MTVDPRVGFYLSIFLAAVSVLAGAGTQLTTLFGDHMANVVLAGVVLVLGAGNAVNAVLHAIPSKPGAANEFPLGPKANP
jgi:hypothetical protein